MNEKYTWTILVLIVVVGLLLTISTCNAFDGTIHSGVYVTEGNSEEFRGNVGGEIRYVTLKNIFKLGGDYYYQEKSNIKNDEGVIVYGKYKHNFTSHFYGMCDLIFEYEYITSIDRRETINPGVGTYLIQNERGSLALDGGLAYIITKYNANPIEENVTAHLGSEAEYKFNNFCVLNKWIKFYPEIDNLDKFRLEGETKLSINLTDKLKFITKTRESYESQPRKDCEYYNIAAGIELGYEF